MRKKYYEQSKKNDSKEKDHLYRICIFLNYIINILIYFQIYESYSDILYIIKYICDIYTCAKIQKTLLTLHTRPSNLSSKTHFPFQPLKIYIS